MSETIVDYKNASYIPREMLTWRMHGAGLENLGINGKAERVPVPSFGPNEILVRTDTVGICFSDVKLISQGSQHKRIFGRDLKTNPATPGHEVSITVVGVGENYRNKYKVGDRFIVQADVYFKGKNVAFGYALTGGYAQYVVLGEEILAGDEGCYLIPVNPNTGYVEAALVEPWTCVVAAYRIHHRRAVKAGGNCLILAQQGFDLSEAIVSRGIQAESHPSKLILSGELRDLEQRLIDQSNGADMEIVKVPEINSGCVKDLAASVTDGNGFDDVICFGKPETALIEELGAYLAAGGVMNMVCPRAEPITATLDVGRIHYAATSYIGCSGPDAALSYMLSRDSELLPDGAAWFIGAAGPMGQMHVQLAIRKQNGPKKILCTDVDNNRLRALAENVSSSAEAAGVRIEFLNPMEVGDEGLRKVINDLTGGYGFDDIVLLAPVASLIETSSKYLADGGVFNIFAGVPEGTMAAIDLTGICLRQHRYVGSSGSRPQDMVDTLAMTESGEIPTATSCAAIGGIHAIHDGVEAVKTGRFPGKTVIFAQIEDLPLTALTDLHKILPNVAEKLADGKFWTKEAEDELLKTKLAK